MNVNTGEVINNRELLERMAGTGANLRDEWITVSEDDLTPEQKERVEKNDQPVVKQKDNRSKLAKLRNQYKKKMKNKSKNKKAKAKRRKNRK